MLFVPIDEYHNVKSMMTHYAGFMYSLKPVCSEAKKRLKFNLLKLVDTLLSQSDYVCF